eukprot:gene27893-36739_t
MDIDSPTNNSRVPVIEPEHGILVTTHMQLLIDQCTAYDYYLRPSSAVILSHLRDELVALAQSYSISGMVLRWGLRQGKAMAKGISRAFNGN